jgi:LmbE family N-acetylglucosaminyl deacetylase
MAGTDANEHPDCFHRADLEEAARRLAAIVRAERPDAVVSDDENGTYGHPDHIKAHHVTVRALALAADPAADVPGEPHVVPRRYVHTFSRSRLLARTRRCSPRPRRHRSVTTTSPSRSGRRRARDDARRRRRARRDEDRRDAGAREPDR